jgi:HEAT repeat protein/PBS lyase HEAT-like repeat-containing protein
MLSKRRLLISSVVGVVLTVVAFCFWISSRMALQAGKSVRQQTVQLLSPDDRVRKQAEAALKHEGSNAIPELVHLLREQDAAWRTTIWATTPKLPRALRRTIARTITWTNAFEVRVAAARALGLLGSNALSAAPALVDALQDNKREVSLEAAGALGRLGPGALPELLPALYHTNAQVRHAAVYAVGHFGSEASPAAPRLTELLQDTNELIRSSAAYSLSRIKRWPYTNVTSGSSR